ncbi:RHS repeat domain-containing protein [Metapseudomonas otitidis]|uniref:RHS repeat domain-containing protein n=1 Tax=Metapseudomonas otitidis TaxID=319939 RepID=UPI00339FFBC5
MGQVRYTTAGRKSQASYYVWLDSLPIAQIDLTYSAGTTIASTTLTYLHSDHLNTPRLATNQGGNLVWSWPSDAFGVGQPNNHGSTIDVILRFPGQIADAHSELFYNYFRDYDPETGRYVESDPIGITRNYKFIPEFLAGGVIGVTSNSKTEINHLYGYSNGNPINLFDPLGLDVCSCLAPQTGVRDDAGNKIFTYNCICTKDSGEKYAKSIQACEGDGGSATCKGQWEDAWNPDPRARTGFEPFNIDTEGIWDKVFNSKYVEGLVR